MPKYDNNHNNRGGVLFSLHRRGAPGRAGHHPAELSDALPVGAALPGGHDLRLYRALWAVHLLPVHGGGPDCAGGGNPPDARHGGADAAADFEVHLISMIYLEEH